MQGSDTDERATIATTSREVPIVVADAIAQGSVIDGRYRLDVQLGEGSMGTVFMAHDLRLKREVAIKIAKPQIARDPELCERLQREAQAMAKLRHPNVVAIYDVGAWRDRPYIVMPYMRGNDLRAWCSHHGSVPAEIDVVVGIMAQVCRGLAAMHAVGLVHRDVKPTNILVSDSFEVTLADLGLAYDAREGPEIEDLGGTPGFLAPELVLGREVPVELAPKADVYAVGVTTYWLLTGHRPTTSDLDELAASYPLELQPPSVHRPGLAEAFDELVLSALHMDPTQRPDAAGFREQLLAVRTATFRTLRARTTFVVVVDDDPLALTFIETITRVAIPGAAVAVFRDPRAALAVIESRPPDLVIADLAMPDFNGMELTAAIRGDPRTREVPVVILSGVGGADDWKVLERIGANRFLVKPVDPDTLFDVVRRVLKVR
jgi:CheY-like chemotaxis protein/tRNA A-37 threonylcarbamoyl transferase component Bud32